MTSKSTIQVANLGNTSSLANVQHATTDDLHGDQVFLVLRIIDKTGSMNPYVNEMVESANENIKALLDSEANNEFLVSTWLFNSREGFVVLDGFVPLADVTPLDANLYGNMKPNDMTNLFDTVHTGLNDPHAGVLAYANQLRLSGITPKIAVAVFTDGDDNVSRVDTREIRKETQRSEGHYFTLFAFGQGFAQQAATEMGFPNVLAFNEPHTNIRKAMGTFSKSLVRASQTTVASNQFIA